MNSWTLLRLNPQLQDRYISCVSESVPDVETYYPTFEKITRPHGKRQPIVVIRPVYPGYVFAKVDVENGNGMRLMMSMPVRARFIKFGQGVSRIPDRVIHELRRLEMLHLLVREVHRISPYSPGVRIRIHTPVADISAVVIALLHGKRLKVDSQLGTLNVPIHQVTLV